MCSDYRKHRKGFDLLKFLAIVGFVIALIISVGWVVMYLWNKIIPPVFGLGMITYWQAVGLLILSRILFGGFGKGRFGNRHNRWHEKKQRWKEKWGKMSEEERGEWKRRM